MPAYFEDKRFIIKIQYLCNLFKVFDWNILWFHDKCTWFIFYCMESLMILFPFFMKMSLKIILIWPVLRWIWNGQKIQSRFLLQVNANYDPIRQVTPLPPPSNFSPHSHPGARKPPPLFSIKSTPPPFTRMNKIGENSVPDTELNTLEVYIH